MARRGVTSEPPDEVLYRAGARLRSVNYSLTLSGGAACARKGADSRSSVIVKGVFPARHFARASIFFLR